jgi:hypothetical protein
MGGDTRPDFHRRYIGHHRRSAFSPAPGSAMYFLPHRGSRSTMESQALRRAVRDRRGRVRERGTGLRRVRPTLVLKTRSIHSRYKRAPPMKNTLLIIGFGITACAPVPHPITSQPAIVDPNDAVRFCLDYMRRAVPAFGLAEAIAMGGTRRAVFDRCLAGQGWAE